MKLSECSEIERRALAKLEARIGPILLRQRLGLEGDHELEVVRRGTHFFHIENWVSLHKLILSLIQITGLQGRGRRNSLNFQLKTNTVVLEALPKAFAGYTLLHLSDLHLDMCENFDAHLLRHLQGLKYDLCVMTGDYRFKTVGSYGPAMEAMTRLIPHISSPTYAVLGNHDTIRMVPSLETLGIRVLMNETVFLARKQATLALVGIDDAHYFRTHNLHKAMHDMPPNACSILLSHTPEPYRHAAHSGLDLMLCGHTHGGQICLPGGLPILTDCDAPRAMSRGAWSYRDMKGYTSVGCGSSIVDVRLNCLPEITLHKLVCP